MEEDFFEEEDPGREAMERVERESERNRREREASDRAYNEYEESIYRDECPFRAGTLKDDWLRTKKGRYRDNGPRV